METLNVQESERIAAFPNPQSLLDVKIWSRIRQKGLYEPWYSGQFLDIDNYKAVHKALTRLEASGHLLKVKGNPCYWEIPRTGMKLTNFWKKPPACAPADLEVLIGETLAHYGAVSSYGLARHLTDREAWIADYQRTEAIVITEYQVRLAVLRLVNAGVLERVRGKPVRYRVKAYKGASP